jgi:hypothetical protein
MTGNGLFLLLSFFVPPVFQLRGDSFNVSDLNFGLGFDARGRASSIVAYERLGCTIADLNTQANLQSLQKVPSGFG